jgi:hypothetical protein
MEAKMIIRSAARLLFIVIVAALAGPAPAVALDGEILIDQARAGTGGITPADDPGFPITINRLGKYKLTSNLSVPPGSDAFLITADNVTIDFNGFRIFGGRFGVTAAGIDGLTVMNGTIMGFSQHGVRARSFAVVQDMQIVNNGNMGVRLDNNGRVIRSTISGNTSINVYCVSRCLIANNVITASETESGVGLFTAAGGHLVLGNVIANNFIFGIYAEGVTGYANNTLTGNNSGGAQVNGAVNAVHPNYCNPACP